MTKLKKAFRTLLILLLIVTVCGFVISLTNTRVKIFNGSTNDSVIEFGCEHDIESVKGQKATCLKNGWNDYVYCRICDYNTKKIQYATGHTVVMLNSDSEITCTCINCNASFSPETYYLSDGTDCDAMEGAKTNLNFACSIDYKPAIVDGHYEYMKVDTTSTISQAQLWIPKNASGFEGFSSTNNAVGLLAFKINTNIDDTLYINLVEGKSNNRWGEDWCIPNIFKTKCVPTIEGGKSYTIYSSNGTVIKEINVAEDEFTGWLDVQIGMELDAETDKITFHYFIDGKYMTTESQELTTLNNSITSVYMSCFTSAQGSGYMIDDIVFGYAENAEWNFES